MKQALGLIWFLSLAGLGACAVDSVDSVDSADSSVEQALVSSSGEAPQASLTSKDEGDPSAQSCSSVWMCDEICGFWRDGVLYRYSTNVLHRYCDDGSDTVLQTHACGENCY